MTLVKFEVERTRYEILKKGFSHRLVGTGFFFACTCLIHVYQKICNSCHNGPFNSNIKVCITLLVGISCISYLASHIFHGT